MHVGLFSDSLGHLDRTAALARCAQLGIREIELGTGGWRRAEHLDLDAALRSSSYRDRLLGELREHDVRLRVLNAAGNPLHPGPHGEEHARRLRATVELAPVLGVDTVVTMSGSPGAPGGGASAFVPWVIAPDHEGDAERQWQTAVEPFWRELDAWAADTAPGLRICLELFAGASVYNPASFERLREAAPRTLALNLDPSHFWWLGIDPLLVVAEHRERIGNVHAKDVRLNPELVARHGLLDFRYPPPADTPWVFTTAGRGHGLPTWAELVAALRDAGYEGALSIEHEPTHATAGPAEDEAEVAFADAFLREAIAAAGADA